MNLSVSVCMYVYSVHFSPYFSFFSSIEIQKVECSMTLCEYTMLLVLLDARVEHGRTDYISIGLAKSKPSLEQFWGVREMRYTCAAESFCMLFASSAGRDTRSYVCVW